MAKLKDGTRIYGDAQVDQTLTVGNITISGNLVVSGTTTSVNSTVTQLEDPIFELGAGPNGAALTGADTAERGILMHYWNGSADTSAYMGWHTTNGQFEFGASATEGAGKDGNITVATYGNVKAFHFIGQGDTLANITGANVTGWVAQANYANYVGQVVDATQSNITALGNLTGLQIGNASTTGNVVITTDGTITATGQINAANTASSTSTTTGALIVGGGTGIAGDLWVGGTIHGTVSGTTSAPGANTNIVFNDDGSSNATAGFTFDKSSNTVSTTALVLGGAANVDGNLNMTATTGNIKGGNLSVLATTSLLLNGGTSYANLTSSSVVLETSGGNVTLNNNGNLTVGTGALKVNSNAAIYADGTANVTAMIATGSGNVGTANVGSAIIRDLSQDQIPFLNGDKRLVGESTFKYTTGTSTLTVANATLSGTANAANVIVTSLGDTRIPFANATKALVDSANLTFNSTSNTLSVFNATLGGTANAAEVIVTSLTSTRVPFVDTDKSLTDDSTFKFTTAGSKLEVGNVDLTGALVAANVTSNNLTSGRVTLAGLSGKLQDSANLTFDGNVLTVTGNVAATNIKTDNLLYANGTAWDLQQAAGTTAGVIQYNDGSNNFAASANLSFNTTGNILTTDSLVLNANANVGNAVVRNLTDTRLVFSDSNHKLVDSSDLTYGSGNLTVNGNIVTGGGSGGNISGVNYLFANIANVVDVNATGNLTLTGYANVTGNLNAGNTIITGNLTVTGTTTSVNTTVSQLTDPLFELGGGANGAALASNDAYDRGLFMHTRTSGVNKDLFMGWDNSNSTFVLAQNVSVVNNVVDYGSNAAQVAANLADLTLSNIYAYNANFGGVVFSNGNVTLGSGSSFVGDVVGNVTGNISGNIKVAGANGSIQFATNVTDHFGATINATAIMASKYYEIVSAGTTDYTLIGAANNTVGTRFTASGVGTGTGTVKTVSTYGDLANDGSNLLYTGGNLSVNVGTGGYVKTDYLTGTLTTASQPNVTSVGTLTSLSTSGNISISNVTPTNGILTDNLYYSNGVAWDLQQAAGLDTYIQYNTSNNFAASANFTYNDSTQLFKVTGNANITSNLFTQTATVSSLSNTRVTFAGASGKLVDDSTFTFVAGKLSVGNVELSGTANAANVIVTRLTATRVPFVDSDKSLTDSANMTFSGTELKVTGTANVTSTLTAANVIVTDLTGGRITFADVSTDRLTDSANLTFDASTKTLTTDYANVITINASTNANVTGSVIAGNVYANSGTVKATYLTGTLTTASQPNITSTGTLTSLTVSGTSNLNAIGNVYISGGTAGQIIQTDGAGNLSFVSNDTTRIVNGNSNVSISTPDGSAVTVINNSTILTVSGTGANVVGVVEASGNITANNITSNNYITANSTTDATSAAVGSAIHTKGGISAEGNVYAGKAVGFAHGSGNTDSAAYIQYNATSGSLDFIFN
jgi:hypothetical protein